MRVLFVTTPWASHYFHLVPLIWAMRASGHEVFVSSQPGFAETIVRSGAIAVPTSRDIDQAALMRRAREDPPAWPTEPPEGVTEEQWSGGWRDVSRRAFPMFVGLADTLADDTIAQAEALRPDLVVYEPMSYVGPVVAAAVGVPAVRHVMGVDVVSMARTLVPPLLRQVTGRLGLPEVDSLGAATVDNCPPSMQLPLAVDRIGTRFVPYNGAGTVPDWLREPPRTRRICVSWGFCASGRGRGFLVPELVKALSDLDVEIVVTLSAEDRRALEEAGGLSLDNVRVVESMPLHLLMPTCDAMLHQSGVSTLLTALSYGVPQLVVPQMPDELMESRPLTAAGAGIAVRAEDADLDTLRARTIELLDDPSYRNAAREIQAENRGRPSPIEAVPRLEALIPSARK